jgi:hypothetical protein
LLVYHRGSGPNPVAKDSETDSYTVPYLEPIRRSFTVVNV